MKILEGLTTIAVVVIGFIGLMIGISLACSLPVWLLWNWLMPEIFGLKTITWIQALGLMFLSCFLVKGFGKSSSKKD